MLPELRKKTRAVAICVATLICLGHGVHAQEAVHGVQFHRLGRGWILSDSKGMSLYEFTRDDVSGKSACVGNCATVWPPYLATRDDKTEGEWSIIIRPDQTLQWAYLGKPLYSYSRDISPGDANGDGIGNGTWVVAFKEISKPPTVSIVRTLKGWVLADNKGMTLYASTTDVPKKTPSCEVTCTSIWHPLRAPWAAVPEGDWSVVTRSDGSPQWAYKDHPLYTYAQDGASGDTLGHSATFGWYAYVLDPPRPVPAWTTVQAADDCDIYGDRKGITIYAHDITKERRRPVGGAASEKDSEPMRRPQDWKPVVATAADKPVGDWAIVQRNDGIRQWAYKGLLLYTNVNDHKPSEINGLRRDDLAWRVVTVSGKLMNGTA